MRTQPDLDDSLRVSVADERYVFVRKLGSALILRGRCYERDPVASRRSTR